MYWLGIKFTVQGTNLCLPSNRKCKPDNFSYTVFIFFFFCLNIKVDFQTLELLTAQVFITYILCNRANQWQLQLLSKWIAIFPATCNRTARMLYSQPPRFSTMGHNLKNHLTFCHFPPPLRMNSSLCPFSFNSLTLNYCPTTLPCPITSTLSMKT